MRQPKFKLGSEVYYSRWKSTARHNYNSFAGRYVTTQDSVLYIVYGPDMETQKDSPIYILLKVVDDCDVFANAIESAFFEDELFLTREECQTDCDKRNGKVPQCQSSDESQ